MRITKKRYTIEGKLEEEVKLVILADVHFYSAKNMKKLNKVLKIVEDIKPDYICMPGDLMDTYYVKDENLVVEWIKKLSKISKVIISLGNHEFIEGHKTYNHDLYSKIISIENCFVLDNEAISFDNISFLGITIPGEYYDKVECQNDKYIISNLKNINYKKNKYNIALCHSPIDFYKKSILDKLSFSKSLDLILCGHMHGGITPNILKPILRGRGFIRPDGKFFGKMCYGIFDNLGPKCIISSGITKSSHTNRLEYLDFTFSPEITIVEIKAKKV